MEIDTDTLRRLRHFLSVSRFAECGSVMTDLDGTAVLEIEGRILLSTAMERGLADMHAKGHRVVANTLRFPLSVMSVIAADWLRHTGSSLPLVSLKGSQIGHVVTSTNGELFFEEIDAFPLAREEVQEVMQGVRGIVEQGGDDLLVFFYPRDWRLGEQIWTPSEAHLARVAAKYRSAQRVFSGPLQQLEDELTARPQCMVFLLVDAPEDRRMAYQHTQRARFVTHVGVDKKHGAQALAHALDLDLADSIGAGDAETDTFLEAAGLAVIVGNASLDFKGRVDTLRLPDSAMLGLLLQAIAATLARQT